MTEPRNDRSAESAAALTERLIQAAVGYELGRIGGPAFTAARTAVERAIGAPAQPAPYKKALEEICEGSLNTGAIYRRIASEALATSHTWEPASAASIHIPAQPPAAPVETCSRCGGSGLALNSQGEPDECRECKGNTVVPVQRCSADNDALKRLADGCRVKAELYDNVGSSIPASFIWVADEIDRIRAVPQEVQDTWLVGGPDLKAMSGSIESNRVIQLHFRRPVNDKDREWLLEAINTKIASQLPRPQSECGK